MFEDLSERQISLINAIIKEYLATSEPVGSNVIVKKYSLRCSPATVRNEMARLLEDGYLDMLHTSSGRVPTPQAYRLFLNEIMEEHDIPVLQEVAIKQRLWPSRFELSRLLRQSTIALADYSQLLAVATTDDGHVIFSGAVNLLDHPEFWDISVAKSALYVFDNYELIEKWVTKTPKTDDVWVLLGDDLNHENLTNCSFVYSSYNVGPNRGYIGVFGPSRMDYSRVIPGVRYTKRLVEELGS